MKKTVRVNISGLIFNIDEDAYNKLRHYLDDINHRFSNDEEGKEVIADVETRIAEIFKQKNKDKEVIVSSDVDDLIEILGRPEDFMSSDDSREPQTPPSAPYTGSNMFQSRRLYRDIDNRILGGVCSGLAHYFGIDPVIFRLIFIISTFVFGSGPLIYIILWIVVPAAVTTSQKLEMRGEPITLINIEKSIKEEFQGVKSSFEKINKGKIGDKFRAGTERSSAVLGSAADGFLRVVVVFIGIVLIIIGISFLFGLITAGFAGHFVTFENVNADLTTLLGLVADPSLSLWAIITFFILIIIPIAVLIYVGLKLIFRFRFSNKIIGLTALGLWLIALGSAIIIGFAIGNNFRSGNSIITKSELKPFKCDTLYISSFIPATVPFQKEEDEYSHHNDFFMDYVNGKLTIFNNPKINIEKSENGKFEVIQKITARGTSREEARRNAMELTYNWDQKDSLLNFSQFFAIDAKQKFRGQQIKITIKVPVGKIVYFNPSSENVIFDVENAEDYWDGDMINKRWIMRPYGLSLMKSDEHVTIENNPKDEVESLKQELKELKNKK